MISIPNNSLLSRIKEQQKSISSMMTTFESPVLKAMESISAINSMLDISSFSAFHEEQNRIAKMISMPNSLLSNIQEQQNSMSTMMSLLDSSVLKATENLPTFRSMFDTSSFNALQEEQNKITKMISVPESSLLNRIQEQQNSISAMMSSLDSSFLKATENIPTIGSMLDISSFSAFHEEQERIAKLTSGIFDSSTLKAMESITKVSSMFDISTFSALQEQHNSIAAMVSGIFDNPVLTALKEQENNFFKRTSLFDTDTIQKILNDIDISEFDETIISEEENSLIDETLQAISDISPEIGTFIKSLELKKYKKATIFMMIWFIYNILPIYQLYNDVFNSDSHYKINRDNVRVRLSPNKEDNTNIITQLNKNTYIEKLDSENGWAKVRFEFDDGIEKEGWIYRTMITKMD